MNDVTTRSDAGALGRRKSRRPRIRFWTVMGLAAVIAGGLWWSRSFPEHGGGASVPPSPPTQVVVSRPLQRKLDTRLGFLGQFSAVDAVDLRAQVGGKLTAIHFKDGDIVHKGDLLFVIDPVPYEIKLAEAKAQLETATARLQLANRELVRYQALKRMDAGTAENVDQRVAEQRAAQAAVDDAAAQVRDAQFDLDHCHIVAPITGRIGSHLVSVGNLIAGSRYASSPTTLLATIVSLDPIYLNFDMSEADYLTLESASAKQKGPLVEKVEFSVNDETNLEGEGTLNFVDNRLDPSSGTIRARATVQNPDFLLMSGEFARVTLDLGPPVPILLVPDADVLPDQSEHIVLTVQPDGTVVPKQVQIGDIRSGLRVIRLGLNPSDNVIIEGIPLATPGQKVVPRQGSIHFGKTSGTG